jgi:dipeptidyl aminopeptidase/acylaminoacyl peptidase
MRIRAASLLVFLVLASPAWAQQTTGRAFTPADWYRVQTVGSAAISPDGRQVAFTVTRAREAENDRHTEVWVVPAAGGEPVRYTAPGHSSSNPRWSPDGQYLYFTSNRPGGRGNTWVLRMHGPGEAFQQDAQPSGSMPRDRSFAVTTRTASGQAAADSVAVVAAAVARVRRRSRAARRTTRSRGCRRRRGRRTGPSRSR